APQHEFSFVVYDALYIIARYKLAHLESRFVDPDGGLGDAACVTVEGQKVEVCGGIGSKQSTIIPAPKIYPLRAAAILPSRGYDPTFLSFNFHRSIWPLEAERKFWPQLAYSQRGLP